MKKLLLILLCLPMTYGCQQQAEEYNESNVTQVYTCSVCKMKFQEEIWAKKCDKWCLENNSCNEEITKHSIE
jgi:hypothetical protein